MKGLILKALAVVGCAAAVTTTSGCVLHPKTLWDPCWPQRYAFLARQEVIDGCAEQVHNGHVLDQTIWNYHFEAGSDKLTPGGLEHLKYLARRRPCPDPMVFLQTAQDVSYDAAAPDKYVEARNDLNTKRTVAVQKFLLAYTAGRGVNFDVVVHDPAEKGMATIPMGLSIQRSWAASQGSLPVSGGAGASNVSGGGGTQ
jgi:hypothetical protein